MLGGAKHTTRKISKSKSKKRLTMTLVKLKGKSNPIPTLNKMNVEMIAKAHSSSKYLKNVKNFLERISDEYDADTNSESNSGSNSGETKYEKIALIMDSIANNTPEIFTKHAELVYINASHLSKLQTTPTSDSQDYIQHLIAILEYFIKLQEVLTISNQSLVDPVKRQNIETFKKYLEESLKESFKYAENAILALRHTPVKNESISGNSINGSMNKAVNKSANKSTRSNKSPNSPLAADNASNDLDDLVRRIRGL
jgi:hypothetical protein